MIDLEKLHAIIMGLEMAMSIKEAQEDGVIYVHLYKLQMLIAAYKDAHNLSVDLGNELSKVLLEKHHEAS